MENGGKLGRHARLYRIVLLWETVILLSGCPFLYEDPWWYEDPYYEDPYYDENFEGFCDGFDDGYMDGWYWTLYNGLYNMGVNEYADGYVVGYYIGYAAGGGYPDWYELYDYGCDDGYEVGYCGGYYLGYQELDYDTLPCGFQWCPGNDVCYTIVCEKSDRIVTSTEAPLRVSCESTGSKDDARPSLKTRIFPPHWPTALRDYSVGYNDWLEAGILDGNVQGFADRAHDRAAALAELQRIVELNRIRAQTPVYGSSSSSGSGAGSSANNGGNGTYSGVSEEDKIRFYRSHSGIGKGM